MDKYELRRQRLQQLLELRCNHVKSDMARKIGVDDSYLARMLYPEGKAGKKRIGEDMVEKIIAAFELPTSWLDTPDDSVAELLVAFSGLTDAAKISLMAIVKSLEKKAPTSPPDEPKNIPLRSTLDKHPKAHQKH